MNRAKGKSIGVVAVVTALCASAAGAQQQVEHLTVGPARTVRAAEFADAAKRFSRLSTARRRDVLERIRARIASIDDPLVRAVRELSEEAGQRRRARVERPRAGGSESETGVESAVPMLARLPFPVEVGYRFGVGTIEPIADRPRSGAKQRAAQDAIELDAMLDGRLPDLDLALAAMLARLDDAREMDRVAAFLDTWTNGAETFYDALDRTAGRADQRVFYADSMLDAWARYCVPRDHADRDVFRRGLDARIRGFQDAFVAYRSYRSVRELIALTLLLEPEDRLPSPLDRFENNARAGSHSTRSCIEVALAAHGHDPLAVITAFSSLAEPVPAQPWQARHEGWRGIDRMFGAVRDGDPDADTFGLERSAHQHRRWLRNLVAEAAAAELLAALAR